MSMVAPSVLEHVRYHRLYADAADFTSRHGSIEDRQIIGLRALFASGLPLADIKTYMSVRRDRHREAGRSQPTEFWQNLLRRINIYEETASQLFEQAEVSHADQYQLIEAFVVCLVAENRYQSNNRDARDNS